MRYFLTIILFICWSSLFAATYEDGNAAYKIGDYSQAMSIWLQLAEHGDARAQYRLGMMYANGKGASKNILEALKWLKLAAEQGDPKIQNRIAHIYGDGEEITKNYEEAIKWYRLAAEQGDAASQNNLGHMYAYGYGIAQNYEEAIKWYHLAAEQGVHQAQINLGWYYMNGFENLPTNLIDYRAAKYWNEQGAKNGDAEGYNNLGWLYENGLGVVRNYTKAAELYQKAVTEGIRTGAKQNNIDEARSRLENVKAKLAKMQNTKKIKSNSSMQIDNDPLNIRN